MCLDIRTRGRKGGAERVGKVNESMVSRRRRNEGRTRGITIVWKPWRGFKTSTPRGKFTASRIRPRH